MAEEAKTKSATPKKANGRRAGRPSSPQTAEDALGAYVAKLQQARKLITDAAALLSRSAGLDTDTGTRAVNDHHMWAIQQDLTNIDYRLASAQRVARAGLLNAPADKFAAAE